MHISHTAPSCNEAPTVVIFGCGNVLLGDDGFGPAVIEQLARMRLPKTVRVVDAGTAIREFLLDYLMLPALRPTLLIVIDAVPEEGGPRGQVRVCTPRDLPACKIHDFSLHQFPTVNLLRELQEETGIEIVLLLARTSMPTEFHDTGLAPPVQAAVVEACARIMDIIAPVTPLEAATT